MPASPKTCQRAARDKRAAAWAAWDGRRPHGMPVMAAVGSVASGVIRVFRSELARREP